eukprot:6483050-Amphidinium_carterae.1
MLKQICPIQHVRMYLSLSRACNHYLQRPGLLLRAAVQQIVTMSRCRRAKRAPTPQTERSRPWAKQNA